MVKKRSGGRRAAHVVACPLVRLPRPSHRTRERSRGIHTAQPRGGWLEEKIILDLGHGLLEKGRDGGVGEDGHVGEAVEEVPIPDLSRQSSVGIFKSIAVLEGRTACNSVVLLLNVTG